MTYNVELVSGAQQSESIIRIQISIPLQILFPYRLLLLLLLLLFCFLGQYQQHMEVPGLRVQSEVQLPSCATATAMRDPSCICNLYLSSPQRQILNPVWEARDRTCNLMVPSQIRFCCTMTGTPKLALF